MSIPTVLAQSMNVAGAGTLVMYDRHVKHLARQAQAERERRVREDRRARVDRDMAILQHIATT